MTSPSVPVFPQAPPGEVWAHLPADEQARAIRLMAQLAYHALAPDRPLGRREARDDVVGDRQQTSA
jgi:hypothetical protein